MDKKKTLSALLAGAVLSAVVGYLLHWVTASWIEADNRERFEHLARNAQYMIRTRLKSYIDVLRGSASMMRTLGNPTREQFHRYVDGLELPYHFPGIVAVNYARRVPAAQMPAFLAEMHSLPVDGPDGYPAFPELTYNGRADPELIVLIDPVEVWRGRYGRDVGAHDVWGGLDRARDTGGMASSGLPLPIMNDHLNMGMALRLPIYRVGMPTNTVAERRAAYVGSIGIGFSMRNLVQNVLDEMGADDVRLSMSDSKAGILLYDSASTRANPAPPMPRADHHTFVTQVEIPFAGRTWVASFSTRKQDAYTRFDASLPWMAAAAGFVVTMLLSALFQTMATSRRRALHLANLMTRELRESQDRLEVSHRKLRGLAAHADHIKEEERKRIAREIHDDLGQNLLALRIEADVLCSRTATRHPRLHARARETMEQIDATIKSVRQIINDLRPNVLDLGLSAAVEWLIADFRRHTGIACELVDGNHDVAVDDHCATAFFRILQESLSNVRRHARATHVQVELKCRDGVLSMTVADNGIGMPPGGRDKANSFGLVGIEERVKILGGTFVVRSEPGAGTLISVSVALARSDRPLNAAQPNPELCV
ncbi:CHASE domain-containing protein [Pseudoduganella sp. GCM10020061]|uniref:sensor histidine kinase n=1 Tax=Pseudoduganella sp. GCM10020061 TaxID=3317345 RepID=UPI00362DC86B